EASSHRRWKAFPALFLPCREPASIQSGSAGKEARKKFLTPCSENPQHWIQKRRNRRKKLPHPASTACFTSRFDSAAVSWMIQPSRYCRIAKEWTDMLEGIKVVELAT